MSSKWLIRSMSSKPQQLVDLALALAEHDGVTHWAVSMRFCGKGDFFKRRMDGSDLHTRNADRCFQWFSDNWPMDLEWPPNIPRPTSSRDVA